MGELPPQIQNIAAQLQQVQQQLQMIIAQKAQLDTLIKESKDALEELKKSEGDFAFKAVGNVLVRMKKDEVEKDLREKIETYEVRKNMLERQENKLRERFSELQNKLKTSLSVQAG